MRRVSVLLMALLVGCGGGGGGGGDFSEGGMTVIGTVVNGSGHPAPLVPVVVEGHAPVLTEANGQFLFEAVSVPYTLILITELHESARVITGLTRSDPVLRIPGGSDTRRAALAGTTSGGVGLPLPPDHYTGFGCATSASGSSESAGVDPTTGAWSIPDLRWGGGDSTLAHVLAVQVHTDATGRVDDFKGLATLDVPVGDGDALSGLEFALGSADTVFCSGAVDTPSGFTVQAKGIHLVHTSGATIPLPADEGPLDTFSLATVDAPGVATALYVSLGTPRGGSVAIFRRDVAVPVSGLSLGVPPETVLVSPTDGTPGVWHETPFRVSPDEDRLYTFLWEPQEQGPEITLYTDEPVATIPDLTAYGLAPPPAADYEWMCVVTGPDFTVDDYTRSEGEEPLGSAEGFYQFTTTRPFTTRP